MDNAASAPIRDEVIEAILPVLRDDLRTPQAHIRWQEKLFG